MPALTYTAIIRWRGPDPTLELVTRHPGFTSPEEAALYANGIPPPTPDVSVRRSARLPSRSWVDGDDYF